MNNETVQSILNRRSIRKYTDEDITDESIIAILEAAQWAPSGLNNQPWKFLVIKDQNTKEALSQTTKYSRIVKECKLCIAVFYNIPSGYNRDKDILSIGAAIQNILLAAHSLNIGTVWLGEILNNKQKVNELLHIDEENELMAVIALGMPAENPSKNRKELDSLIIT